MSGVPRGLRAPTPSRSAAAAAPRRPSRTGGSPSRRSFASIVRDRAAAQDQRRAPPGLLEGGRRVRRAARAAAAVERAVAVVGLVHLRHQADVGRLPVLGDPAVEAEQVAVAVAAGDPARRDDLAGAVAVLGGDVQHQPRAGPLGAAEDELVRAAELREEAEHRRVVAGLALEAARSDCAARHAREDLAARRQQRVGRGGGGEREQAGGGEERARRRMPDHRPRRRAACSVRARDRRTRPRPRRAAALLVGREHARLRRLPRRGVGQAGARRPRALRAAVPGGVPVRALVADDPAQARGLPRRLRRLRARGAWPRSATTTWRG